MKTTEFRDMQSAQLREHLTKLQREYFDLRMQLATRQLAKPSELRRVRRDMARAQTFLRAAESHSIGRG